MLFRRRGPSRLVYERTLSEGQGHREVVRTTALSPCIAIRVETAINGYAMYSLIVRKGERRSD